MTATKLLGLGLMAEVRLAGHRHDSLSIRLLWGFSAAVCSCSREWHSGDDVLRKTFTEAAEERRDQVNPIRPCIRWVSLLKGRERSICWRSLAVLPQGDALKVRVTASSATHRLIFHKAWRAEAPRAD